MGGPADSAVASGCVVVAEVASTCLILMTYISDHGWIRPKFRRRAWISLARRGAVAGATRFARVSLYAADILILGTLATAGLGPYAASRRVVFALLALGLVVPSAIGPRIARAWVSGSLEARLVIMRAFEGMSLVVLPATVGLMATSHRWVPWLFRWRLPCGGRLARLDRGEASVRARVEPSASGVDRLSAGIVGRSD